MRALSEAHPAQDLIGAARLIHVAFQRLHIRGSSVVTPSRSRRCTVRRLTQRLSVCVEPSNLDAIDVVSIHLDGRSPSCSFVQGRQVKTRSARV